MDWETSTRWARSCCRTRPCRASRGLAAWTTIEDTLFLGDDLLLAFHGLEGVTTVNNLTIARRPRSRASKGSTNLTTVSNDLIIDRNAVLTDVTALYGLVDVGGDVLIDRNDILTDAAAQLLVDQIDNIGGTITITANN